MGAKKKQIEKKVRIRPQKLAKLLQKEKNNSTCSTIGLMIMKILLIIIGLIVTVLLLMVLYFTIFVYNSDSENKVDTKYYSVGEMLMKNVELSLEIVQQKNRLEDFFDETELIEFIKIQMRPIQERVSSLLKQTAQYEKLPHIPGGPKHFITTTLKELYSIEHKYLKEVASEVVKSLNNRVTASENLIQKFKIDSKTREAIVSFVNVNTNNGNGLLVQEGVYLAPPGTNTTDYKHINLENYEHMDIVKAHLELAELFPVYHNSIKQMSKYVQEHYPSHQKFWTNWDPKDFPNDPKLQALLTAYHEGKQKFREAVEKDKEKYPLLAVYTFQAMERCDELKAKLDDFEESPNEPYLDLQTLILTDIRKLRVRVENLKYNYAKKQ